MLMILKCFGPNYSYLKRQNSLLESIICIALSKLFLSGVHQGSVLGPFPFNGYIYDLFCSSNELYCITMLMITCYLSNNLTNLIEVLEEEAGNVLNRLLTKSMIANPEKFHLILICKDQEITVEKNFNVQGKMIKSKEIVKLLGIQLNYKLKCKLNYKLNFE